MKAFDTEVTDDLFSRPPRSVARAISRTGRITCRFCGLAATVLIDHPALLCPLCIENIDRVRDLVAGQLAAADTRYEASCAAWLAVHTPLWDKIEQAMEKVNCGEVSQAAFDAQWAKRKAEGGALAILIGHWETHQHEVAAINAELARLELAQREINLIWLKEER